MTAGVFVDNLGSTWGLLWMTCGKRANHLRNDQVRGLFWLESRGIKKDLGHLIYWTVPGGNHGSGGESEWGKEQGAKVSPRPLLVNKYWVYAPACTSRAMLAITCG